MEGAEEILAALVAGLRSGKRHRDAGFEPTLRWFGPSSGWAPVFASGDAVVCGFAFSNRPLAGLMGITEAIERALRRDSALARDALAIVDVTPKRRVDVSDDEKQNFWWVDYALDSDAATTAFISLIEGKIRALNAQRRCA